MDKRQVVFLLCVVAGVLCILAFNEALNAADAMWKEDCEHCNEKANNNGHSVDVDLSATSDMPSL